MNNRYADFFNGVIQFEKEFKSKMELLEQKSTNLEEKINKYNKEQNNSNIAKNKTFIH